MENHTKHIRSLNTILQMFWKDCTAKIEANKIVITKPDCPPVKYYIGTDGQISGIDTPGFVDIAVNRWINKIQEDERRGEYDLYKFVDMICCGGWIHRIFQ